MKNNKSIKQPQANNIYGQIIYWLAIVAAVVCIIGPVMILAFPENNVLNPQHVFTSIWEGSNPAGVWQNEGATFPGAHFWFNHLNRGDGLTQIGIVLGGVCAGFALLGAAIGYLRGKPRSYGWAVLCILTCIMIILAAMGIYS